MAEEKKVQKQKSNKKRNEVSTESGKYIFTIEGMRKKKKRLGRGESSGLGKTSGRGTKGQKSRSGAKIRRGFEGGQMPLYRRIPKRGFKNVFKKDFYIINLDELDKKVKENDVLNIKRLCELGFIEVGDSYKKKNKLIKILGRGEITKPITVYAHKISKSCGEKILKAGGKIYILSEKVKLRKKVLELKDEKLEKSEYKIS